MRERPPPQPIQQFVGVGRAQHIGDGVRLSQGFYAAGDREQMQIVVAEHCDRAFAQTFYQAQHTQRMRPAVHQVAAQPQHIFAGAKMNFFEERLQFRIATLHIADRINRHKVSTARARKNYSNNASSSASSSSASAAPSRICAARRIL